jgi:hypothetical protein
MACPKCASEEWKLASVIHTEGKRGNKQTELSKLAAPPTNGRLRKALLFFFDMAWVGWGTFVIGVVYFSDLKYAEYPIFTTILFKIALVVAEIGTFGLLIVLWMIPKSLGENHKLALLEYEKKRMCVQCGALYFEDDNRSA